MRAFMTGGPGFVGRSLIESLQARGDEVRALARSPAAVATVEKAGAESISGDLENDGALRSGIPGGNLVFYSAALMRLWGRFDDCYRVNVEGTKRVLTAAQAAGVPCRS